MDAFLQPPPAVTAGPQRCGDRTVVRRRANLASAPEPASTMIGTGPDSLVLLISGDT